VFERCTHLADKKKGKKKKKKKSSIKAAKTPFMIFSMENRAKVVEDNKGITFGDVGKKLGALYVFSRGVLL